MTLNSKDPDTDRLARELTRITRESLTTAVTTALRERLTRLDGGAVGRDLPDEVTGDQLLFEGNDFSQTDLVSG